MTPSLVTVVTPVFNGAEHLAATLNSVGHQTMQSWEHIVVNDGSTDDSAEIVRHQCSLDSRVSLVQQNNQGLSAARNVGFQHASDTARYVIFLDDDDLMRPRCLERLVAALEAAPESLAAHGEVAAVDASGHHMELARIEASARRTVVRPERIWSRRTDVRHLTPDEPSTIDALAYVLFIYTVGQVLIRRSFFEELGGFDPLLRVAQDYDLWLRMSSRSPLGFVPEPLLDYRQASGSLSADQATTRREDLYARFKAMTDPTLPPSTRAIVRQMHRHHEWHRAADRFDHLMVARRERDARRAVREFLRLSRSAAEAAIATLPIESMYTRRVEHFRRSLTGQATLGPCDEKLMK